MKEELWRTVKLFLLWWFLFLTPVFIGIIVWYIYGASMHMDSEAIKEQFFSNQGLCWAMVVGNMLIAIVFFGKRYVKLSFGRIERHMVWSAVGISILIAAAYMLVESSVFTLLDVDHLFSEESEKMNEDNQQLFSGIAGILYGCIFAPVAEEIGFRGVLLDGLLKTRCRPWLAILISALAFGLLHYSVQFVGAMVFGIIVGWLYWRTGSILPGIIIHIVNNTLSFIDVSSQSNTVLLVILIVCLLLLVYGLWWFGKKCNFADEFNQTINTNK